MSESDKELLKLAAKAASIPIDFWNDGSEPYSSGEGFVLPSNAIWNPLKDDGDALRLAVKLNMTVSVERRVIEVEHCIDGMVYGTEEDGEKRGCDPLAASRRAIVRAAAKIGKAMP